MNELQKSPIRASEVPQASGVEGIPPKCLPSDVNVGQYPCSITKVLKAVCPSSSTLADIHRGCSLQINHFL